MITQERKPEIEKSIETSLMIAAPSWPLQNTVAVNPFWFLRDKLFRDVVVNLAPVVNSPLLMPMEFYLQRYEEGTVTAKALEDAMRDARPHSPDLPHSLDSFLMQSRDAHTRLRALPTFAEFLDTDGYWQRTVTNDLGKFAAGYFDDDQAIFPFPWKSLSFWQAWCEARAYDHAMEICGASGFNASVAPLKSMSCSEAVIYMIREMDFKTDEARTLYMQRLIASVLGWATRFKYVEWQTMLGYDQIRSSTAMELLCVRLAYDFGLFHTTRKSSSPEWREEYEKIIETDFASQLTLVWQAALERSYQDRVAGVLQRPSPQDNSLWQMAFCIDVRSETIRRHIEEQDSRVKTIGFAGFFGVPLAYRKLEERDRSLRMPVLLSPAFTVKEVPRSPDRYRTEDGPTDVFVLSYFRNLRKSALSSFLFVELFGILSIENIVRKTLVSIIRRLKGKAIPARFDDRKYRPAQETLSPDGNPEGMEARVQRAITILKRMGLREPFGRLVFIVGHGSVTNNNAFGSALDCGACGGHAGDINARYLADLLNDSEVRVRLAQLGIQIAQTTWFVAAVHETVTDEVFFLDEETIPVAFKMDLEMVRGILNSASSRARAERQKAFKNLSVSSAQTRGQNWSEVRPEWGLAGNACFIVAPRERTRGVNLGSRAFLHDYNYAIDDEFKTLELIMTAPMVVTNWINMQYYASTVANGVYGAGSKVLHNLVAEMGVLEGNGGDLRVGLPLQSISDGKDILHEPLRLSVFIEAPRDAIEDIVKRHETVRQLLDHEWLHLLQIDPSDGQVWRRLPGGNYAVV